MYLQDVHVENYANRGKSIGMRMVTISMGILAFLCLLFGMIFPPFFLGVIGFGLLSWFLSTRVELDFDYAYTNGSIDISKVFNKSSRKRFLSFDMKDVIVVGPVGSDSVRAYQGRGLKTIDCSARNPEIKTYEVVYHDKKSSNAETIVIMDLEDDFLEAMKAAAPRVVNK